MRKIERATRAELRDLGVRLSASALGQAAVDLAGRLDEHPGDRAATMLSRELRLVMAALQQQVKGDVTSEVDAFLASVSAPVFDAGH